MVSYPNWVVLHVPHHSNYIPPAVRGQFLLTDEQLTRELILMTDEGSEELFNHGSDNARIVQAAVSRLVVDVERFTDDSKEKMVGVGMGVIYTKTAHNQPLRNKPTSSERNKLLNDYYYPHHEALEKQVEEALKKYNHCIIIDCHTFPSKPLPFELNQNPDRPDICIGTDDCHTSERLEKSFVTAFKEAGFKVSVNQPFAGALVPYKFYAAKDARVQSVMVEVNRILYMDETTGQRSDTFKNTARTITATCQQAMREVFE
jgi:N-formylglutamate deformylase